MGRVRKNHSKAAVANYWMEWEAENGKPAPWVQLVNGYGFWDYGEPSCMACGIWHWNWDEPYPGKSQFSRGPFWEMARQWNRSRLERCHIVSIYRGGPDEVSNMVLMCGLCHDYQPDTDDPEDTFRYMRRRHWMDSANLARAALPDELVAELSKKKPDWSKPIMVTYFGDMNAELARYAAEATE